MTNESELGLLGQALGEIGESSDPRDAHVRNLLSAALVLRGGDIYPPRKLSLVLAVAGEPAMSIQPDQFVKTPLQLADLRTTQHFRDYFVHRLGMFLGREVPLALPSQEHVDRGSRIKAAGFTTFEPVVFPSLTIGQNFHYPDAWRFHLNPWIYQQIKAGNLNPDVLNLEETWGWLDTSKRLDWKSGDPMLDPETNQVWVDLLSGLRAKGKEDGIEVTRETQHLASGSLYGISADEAKMKVYPAIAAMIGVKREEVVDLTAAQFIFTGNWRYRHLGEQNSWEWVRNIFGVGGRLIVGRRVSGGLSLVSSSPSGDRLDFIRPRPLVVSLFVA